jgi:hypothetical protein
VVFGVFAAAAPVMMIGAVYIANSAARLDWPLFTLGAWLVVTAAASAFAGPVGVWGVGALAGGGGFLLVAALHDRLRRL